MIRDRLSNICLLLTAYCLLLTAYCLLLTAYCLLPSAFSVSSVVKANVKIEPEEKDRSLNSRSPWPLGFTNNLSAD
jgi:hypothetical protein